MTRQPAGTALAIATPIAVLATLAVNTLSNIAPASGQNIGDIANTVLQGVLITPANYAFAIWGLIYVGLIVYSLYQIRPARQGDRAFQQVDALLIVACLAQIAWVYLFTFQQFWLSVIAMLTILLSLIAAYLQLNSPRSSYAHSSPKHLWRAQIPLSIYLGWISVATIVNIASALYAAGWTEGGEIWTVIMLAVGAVLGAIVVIRRRDIAFTLVFIWAYIAIAIRQADTPILWIMAVIGAIGLAILLGMRIRWSAN